MAALATGIILNLALLGSFKYLPEVAVHLPLSLLQRFSHLALPLGLSFWTFQALSYLFDLYRGEELDPSFFEFALFMVFFPVTIAGPIAIRMLKGSARKLLLHGHLLMPRCWRRRAPECRRGFHGSRA